jgi:RNA polymerase sigma-70 factor (ECF subfamily)
VTITDRLALDLDGMFEEFVRTYQDAVYGAALRLTCSRPDAEDVAQETFVRAYKALSGWDQQRIRELAIKPWLARITLNVCRNRARTDSRRPRTTTLDGMPDGIAVDRSPAPDHRVDSPAVTDQVATLSPVFRAPVVLRHAYGLSYEEVADVLGRPVGTVKAQVSRAIQQLQRQEEQR